MIGLENHDFVQGMQTVAWTLAVVLSAVLATITVIGPGAPLDPGHIRTE
ncbi:hypothetical protein [Janibacter sp. G56]